MVFQIHLLIITITFNWINILPIIIIYLFDFLGYKVNSDTIKCLHYVIVIRINLNTKIKTKSIINTLYK